ncbi:MAG: sulfotransferase [Myxococcales bacterium]|nr:sulfotransferase [Myxococcales bacterium]
MRRSQVSAPPPHRTRFIRLLNSIGGVMAPRWPSLDPNSIVRAAARKAESDEFGDEGFLKALPILLDTVEREARLTWIGRVACRQSFIMALESRFGIYRHRAQHPEVVGVPIDRPLFIVGFPRTGTTILFNLLAQDPANRAPLGWEIQFPNPPPETATYATDPRIEKARKYFGQMDAMAPSLASIHEVGADLPQECMPILAHSMLSPQASIAFNVPSYQDWVDHQDAAPAYTYHRHFLEHLQSRHMKDRWVLKSPVHLATLDALLDEYPDAQLIFTHRDPVKTIPSLASLVYTVRGIVTDAVDPKKVGPEQLDWWAKSLDHAMKVRARHADKPDQFMDIQFDEVVADPVAALGRAYAHFRIPWSDEVEGRMRRFLVDNPREKHGSHRYELEDFGIERDQIRERFAGYCRAYDIPLA